MAFDARLIQDVASHRKMTELRLLRLLQRAQIDSSFDSPIDMIQWVVFDYHHTRFDTFFSQMTAMFASAPVAVDKDALFLVMGDVWHYFPHTSLNGKSPAEIVDAGAQLGRWKTKPVKRSSR
jgi:hypothetical protein